MRRTKKSNLSSPCTQRHRTTVPTGHSDDPFRLLEFNLRPHVSALAARWGARDACIQDDLTQQSTLRLLEIGAPLKYDPKIASVETYSKAVAGTVVWEHFGRRYRPPMESLDIARDPPNDDDPTADLEQGDTKAWLRGLLEPLSDGEVRALANALGVSIHPFWNVIGHRPPKRLGSSGDALPRALGAFKKLRESGW